MLFEGGFWQETDQTVCNISLLCQVFGSVIDDTAQQGFVIQPTLLQPKSVGEIYLSVTDPYNYLLIDPHCLESSHDVEVLKRSIKVSLQIMNTSAFHSKGITLTAEMANPPYKYGTDNFGSG